MSSNRSRSNSPNRKSSSQSHSHSPDRSTDHHHGHRSNRSRSRSRDRSDIQGRSPPDCHYDKNRSRDRDRDHDLKDSPKPDGIKLYLGNLTYSTTEQRIREVFGEFGLVQDVFLPVERGSNRPRGFGFVTLDSRSAAEQAIQKLDQSQLDGRMIRVSESRPRGQGPSGEFNRSGQKDVRLYVGNLSLDATEESVKNLFSKFGPVTDCFLPTDRDTNQVRGFAFVTMPAEDAEKACEKLDGEEHDGRTIYVNEARPKGSSRGIGSGYDDRRGGGYGGGPGPYGGDRGGYGGGPYGVPHGGYGGPGGPSPYGGGGYEDPRGGPYGGGGGYEDRGGYGRGGYDDPRGGYGPPHGGYGGPSGGYDDPRGGYGGDRGGYDDRRGGYDDHRSGHEERGYGRGGYEDRGGGGYDRGY